MKRKSVSGAFALALALTAGYGVKQSMKPGINPSDREPENVEALAYGESDNFCYAGGEGAGSCSIGAGIDIFGFGVSGGCSVECIPGYYACRSLRCTCGKILKI